MSPARSPIPAAGRRPPGQRRWMGVGRSTHPDSYPAALAATHRALVGEQPKLLLVFAAISHDPATVLAGVRAGAPGVPVIGCSTHGEIGPEGHADGSVTIAAIGGPGFEVTTAAATQVAGHQRAAGVRVAASASRDATLPHRVFLLLTDGLMRDQEEILRGCYATLGASVPLVGGAAADGWRMEGVFLLGDGSVLREAVVGAMITSEAPMSVSVRHGWRATGRPMIVTHSADGRVHTLDDQPALDVYLRRLSAPREAYTDPAAFTAFALPRPLGVQRRSGIEARNLSTEVDLAGRTIGGGSAIAHGGLVWAMTGDTESILAATDAACQDALAGLGGADPIGMLTFSCAALRAVLGDDGTRREWERLAKWADGLPFAGFHTYGEVARVRGVDGFHNQSLALLALS